MNVNGFRLKNDSELTEYEKRIDSIDNVILCMAAAERLVSEIGKSMVTLAEAPIERKTDPRRPRRPFWKSRRGGAQR